MIDFKGLALFVLGVHVASAVLLVIAIRLKFGFWLWEFVPL